MITNYITHASRWLKHYRRYRIDEIEVIHGIDRQPNERKESFLRRVRATLLVAQFNDKYPVGSKLRWKPVYPGKDEVTVTVKTLAFVRHNQPLVFFEEYAANCSIETEFFPQ